MLIWRSLVEASLPPFPTVYGAQRQVLQTTAQAGTIRARAQRRELSHSIRSGYYNLLVRYRLVGLLPACIR